MKPHCQSPTMMIFRTPLLEILTLGYLATACCIMLILVCADITWLDIDLKTLPSSVIFSGPLLAAPLPWSLDKGVLSLPNLIWRHLYEKQCVNIACPAPLPADDLI